MDAVNFHRPHRAVIRCKAKMKLLAQATAELQTQDRIDDALIKELATNLFLSKQYRVFFESPHAKSEVEAVEDQLAQEIAEAYQLMARRQQDPLVQQLNSLV